MISSIETGDRRSSTGGVLDRHTIPGARTAIGTAYALLFSACILPFLSIDTLAWLGEEDGPVENAGALCFLLAGILFFSTAHKTARLHRQWGAGHSVTPLVLYALGALLLVCFGEEISWGQRLFHYPVPGWVEAINQQGEWNLHNLTWFQAHTVEGVKKSFWARLIDMNRLLAIFQLTVCTLVPAFTAYPATCRAWVMRIGLPVFPWWIAGLVPVHLLVSQTLYAIIGGGGDPILGDVLDETKETMRAFIFLVVAMWAYGRATATASTAAGTRPPDAVGP
ncbi:MAG: hypothetical protein CAF45_006155 [Nitrospira sp. CG24E]|nr:MAG: hypothetical protein CAF45_006155 [Nitrospira sp. CG24E]